MPSSQMSGLARGAVKWHGGLGRGRCTKAVLPGLGGWWSWGHTVLAATHCSGVTPQARNTRSSAASSAQFLSSWGHIGQPWGSSNQSDTFAQCHVPISPVTSQMIRSVVWHLIFQSCGSWWPWGSHGQAPRLTT